MKTRIGAGAKAAAKALPVKEAGDGGQKTAVQSEDNTSETSEESRRKNRKSKKKKKKNRR